VSRTAAFYWGYLIGVLPIALLLRRLPVAKTLSCFIFVRMPIVHVKRSRFRLLTTCCLIIRSGAYSRWRPPGSHRTQVPSRYDSFSAWSNRPYLLASYSVSHLLPPSCRVQHPLAKSDRHIFRSHSLVVPPCRTPSTPRHLVLCYRAVHDLLRPRELRHRA
jgi:hypothetical protein